MRNKVVDFQYRRLMQMGPVGWCPECGSIVSRAELERNTSRPIPDLVLVSCDECIADGMQEWNDRRPPDRRSRRRDR